MSALAFLIVTSFSKVSLAYLDPGTIGMAFQVLVVAVAGIILFFKIGLGKVKSFFKRLFSGKSTGSD